MIQIAAKPGKIKSLEMGATTEREAVEMALSLVTFRRELGNGVGALRQLKLSRID